jgi:hypothetical protein
VTDPSLRRLAYGAMVSGFLIGIAIWVFDFPGWPELVTFAAICIGELAFGCIVMVLYKVFNSESGHLDDA